MNKNNNIIKGILLGLFFAIVTGTLFGNDMYEAKNDYASYIVAKKELRNFEKEYERKDISFQLEEKAKLKGLTLIKEEKEKQYNKSSLAHSSYLLINFLGKAFLNFLTLLVIPLIFASIIIGIKGLGDIRHTGRTGLRAVIYYFTTTAFAVIIGIIMVSVITPGKDMHTTNEITQKVEGKEDLTAMETVLNVFVNEDNSNKGMFPKNIIGAAGSGNVLSVIFFSILLGGALTTIGSKKEIVFQFFDAINDALMKIIHLVLMFLPIGIFALITERIVKAGGIETLFTELKALSLYFITVVLSLSIHAIFVLPFIYFYITKKNPLTYAKNMLPALMTAFSTASSSATLPATIECVIENNKVSEKSASFVLPLGATINMDGTALYEAVAVIFIAQSYGISLGFTALLVVFLTATLAAVGAAGIPEAGLVTMVIVLNAVGLPLEGIGLLLSIDWLLDRCRTTVNVWGDSLGAGIIDYFEETKEETQA